MNLHERLRLQREGGQVQRCHTTPHHGSYDNAQHTFNMLLLLFELHPDPSYPLIYSITYHDLPERIVGDAPATLARQRPEVKAAINRLSDDVQEKIAACFPLTEDERHWLKALDDLEYLLWVHDQLAMGNEIVRSKLEPMDCCFQEHVAAGRMPDPVLKFWSSYKWERGPDVI